MSQHQINKNDTASFINKKITYILNTEFIKIIPSTDIADKIISRIQKIAFNFQDNTTVVLNKSSVYDFAVDIVFPSEKDENITMSYGKVMNGKNPKKISGWKAFYGNR